MTYSPPDERDYFLATLEFGLNPLTGAPNLLPGHSNVVEVPPDGRCSCGSESFGFNEPGFTFCRRCKTRWAR